MRRSFTALGLAAVLTAVGACSTLGQPAQFDLAELTVRCDSRGGTLRPTGAETGRAQADYVCHERTAMHVPGRHRATADLGRATHDALVRGGPVNSRNGN